MMVYLVPHDKANFRTMVTICGPADWSSGPVAKPCLKFDCQGGCQSHVLYLSFGEQFFVAGNCEVQVC